MIRTSNELWVRKSVPCTHTHTQTQILYVSGPIQTSAANNTNYTFFREVLFHSCGIHSSEVILKLLVWIKDEGPLAVSTSTGRTSSQAPLQRDLVGKNAFFFPVRSFIFLWEVSINREVFLNLYYLLMTWIAVMFLWMPMERGGREGTHELSIFMYNVVQEKCTNILTVTCVCL